MPPDLVDAIWETWDAGMARAILDLYRSADPRELALAGAALHELAGPALVIWGERDPYLPTRFAHAFGARLPDATVELYPDAGHWPWIDRPEIAGRVAAFLEAR